MSTWHLIRYNTDGSGISCLIDSPSQSGKYLCTCIVEAGNVKFRYLKMMQYDSATNTWKDDFGKGISSKIIAWKEEQPYDGIYFDIYPI